MTLEALNHLDRPALVTALQHCCGSSAWVGKMLDIFPLPDVQTLFDEASVTWRSCIEKDWLEAFSHHPRIGVKTTNATAAAEQAGAKLASTDTLEALVDGNRRYEEKFGYIYIVCATGKSASEMLDILTRRLKNTPDEEIFIAMGEQEKITRIRLEKLLV